MIYFRLATEPHGQPVACGTVRRWYLEYYDEEMPVEFPVGMAFVTETLPEKAQLHFVFVADPWRGNGFATELVLAAKKRWPDLHWTAAMGSTGAAILKSAGLLEQEGEA